MKKSRILLSVAASLLAGSAWLGAQTEVPPPAEGTPAAPGADAATVDDRTKTTADDALKNFRGPAATTTTTTEETVVTTSTATATEAAPAAAKTTAVAPAPATTEAVTPANDPIIPSDETVNAALNQAKVTAAAAGVSQENIEKAAEVAEDVVEKAKDMSASDVDEAMKALEALGNQARKSLEEAEVTGDTAAAGEAQGVAETEAGEAGVALMPDTLPEGIPADAAERASAVVRELGADPAALEAVDAQRGELVARVIAESEAKKDKLKFRRAFTRATNSAEAQALWDASEAAPTFDERREILRQYYKLVFDQVRKVEPELKKYANEREAFYVRQINAQEPLTTAISVTAMPPVGEPGKARGKGRRKGILTPETTAPETPEMGDVPAGSQPAAAAEETPVDA